MSCLRLEFRFVASLLALSEGSKTLRTLLVVETCSLGSSIFGGGLSCSLLDGGGFGGWSEELARRIVLNTGRWAVGDGLGETNRAPSILLEDRSAGEALNMAFEVL